MGIVRKYLVVTVDDNWNSEENYDLGISIEREKCENNWDLLASTEAEAELHIAQLLNQEGNQLKNYLIIPIYRLDSNTRKNL